MKYFFSRGGWLWANDVSVPRKVTPGLPGWNFFVQCPGLIFLAAHWSGPAASASIFSVCLDNILRVCQSLWDSFLYLGKLRWFLYLRLSYFYDPGMFIFGWSSNFVEFEIGPNELPEMRFKFPFSLIDKLTVGSIMAPTQILVHRWGPKPRISALFRRRP